MNNIKDIIIGIFAVIGFVAIVTGFTNETSDPQYPESHVWEIATDADDAYIYNKQTGVVRILSGQAPVKKGYITFGEVDK